MKVYSKPEILFEDFSLSTNIAAGCELKTDTLGQGQCAYVWDGGYAIFTSDVAACEVPVEEGTNDGLCYHNPSQERNVFNS